MITLKQQVSNVHIEAIGRIIASGGSNKKLEQFFDLVGVKYTVTPLKARLEECETLEEVEKELKMERGALASRVQGILNGIIGHKLERIKML